MADYQISGYTHTTDNALIFDAILSNDGKVAPKWPDVVENLNFDMRACTENSLRIQVTDKNDDRWRHPVTPNCIETNLNQDIEIEVPENPKNALDFHINFDGNIIANFNNSQFIFSDQEQLKLKKKSKKALSVLLSCL